MSRNDQSCQDATITEYASKLKAVGHPIRLKLLCLIDEEDDPCVTDLWRCLGQPQPVISQHLAILKENGIVSAEVQKTRRVYTITDPFIKSLVAKVRAEEARAKDGPAKESAPKAKAAPKR
jgi:ArsR family transcriptional regulator, arsenate/arsenite/antimonite-responsive transcriptional repressor